MSELFLTVLNMSLTASYVIIFVMLIRLLLKKTPKIISYALWSVVAFRLIFPFSFESIFSLMPRNTNTVPISHDIIYQQNPQFNSGIEVVDSFVSQSLPVPIIGASANPLQIYAGIVSYIWVLGIIALLVYSIVSILVLKRQLITAELIEKNIYEANNLKTPFVLGLVRPEIYLPVGLSVEERGYILLHEQTHIQRKDHIIKVLAFLILSIHWFNPLVWIAFMLMSADMELSCDERVLNEMNDDVKRPYANSLLSLATGKHVLNGSPLAFGEGNVSGRIKNVLNYKKPSFWVILLAIIIIVVISIGLLTNPKKQESILHAENTTSYEIVHLSYGDEQYLISPLSGDSAKLVEKIIMDSLIKSSIYKGTDIREIEDCYLLRATYNDDTVIDNYTFIYNGRSVLQRGENGYYTFINEELYEKLVESFNNQQLVSNEPTNYDKISAYLKEEFINVFSPYYELIDFIISDYHEEVVDGNVEAIFSYTIVHKNYDRDPDTVQYIKEAKERGDKYYQTYYNEYLQPQNMNFYFKAVIDENNEITLYSKNLAIENDEWIETRMSDYIIKKTEEVSETSGNLNKTSNVLIENDIADFITYNFENRSMYIVGLEIFNEFGTEEFGYINEGSVNINSENVLEFYIIYYTGSYISGGTDIPGPEVRFKMNLDTNEIVEKEFTTAPNYAEAAELYPEYINPDSIKYSEKMTELSDERMVEIGLYFKNYIFEIEAR
ncbi:M56 family metallopeptidase [Sedimentibacter sp. MB31-C6]|uniref:M56 family metallopeptidase n=1 Tax=Sedimentibacter sp. MB31-C6 TaxID=3109366 RepID=UPI002DDCF5B5|nr:M56 family metallopeptidase [Sedimentibacter sp. MB36-C1]WSI05154.1 M56 family metallopeptidase [Sedimentibacter sp. MB36-C1]